MLRRNRPRTSNGKLLLLLTLSFTGCATLSTDPDRLPGGDTLSIQYTQAFFSPLVASNRADAERIVWIEDGFVVNNFTKEAQWKGRVVHNGVESAVRVTLKYDALEYSEPKKRTYLSIVSVASEGLDLARFDWQAPKRRDGEASLVLGGAVDGRQYVFRIPRWFPTDAPTSFWTKERDPSDREHGFHLSFFENLVNSGLVKEVVDGNGVLLGRLKPTGSWGASLQIAQGLDSELRRDVRVGLATLFLIARLGDLLVDAVEHPTNLIHF